MNEEDIKPTREYLKSILVENELTVEFTKADGTKRKLLCTLKADELPKFEIKEGAKPKKVNEDILSVWDLENNGWRSFRIDTVTAFSFSL